MKIDQGEFTVSATRQEAIDRFRQMQGPCREVLSDEKHVYFRCSKKGKIAISSYDQRRNSNSDTGSRLFAEILEQNGKTYVSYKTSYSIFYYAYMIFLSIFTLILLLFFFLLFEFVNEGLTLYPIIVLAIDLVFLAFQLLHTVRDKRNSKKHSEIMINELEKRVEAINLWDK